MLHQFLLVQTQNLAEILVSAEIPFVNLNLSTNSAETKISDLRKISAEIWLRLETFRESGPCTLSLTLFSSDPKRNRLQHLYDLRISIFRLKKMTDYKKLEKDLEKQELEVKF